MHRQNLEGRAKIFGADCIIQKIKIGVNLIPIDYLTISEMCAEANGDTVPERSYVGCSSLDPLWCYSTSFTRCVAHVANVADVTEGRR